MKYAVWVEIEAQTDDGDVTVETQSESENINASRLDFGSCAQCDTLEEAIAFANTLNQLAKGV